MRHWTVSDVMTTQVVSVPADAGYRQIVDLLARHKVSALPVVDDAGRVLGVVSEADVLHKIEAAGDDQPPRLFPWRSRHRRAIETKARAYTARDLMTTPVVTVGSDAPIVAAAKLIETAQVKRLPVVDHGQRLLGIVSRRDLIKIYLRPDADIRDDIRDEVLRRSLWIDPATVRVEVTGGVVELAGRVDRRTTAIFMVRLAESVPGVVRVVDRLSWEHDDIPPPLPEPT